MKAVVLNQTGGPEQLLVEDVATPHPGPGQVRVALRAAALNRRDVWITVNKYPGIRLPCILGSDGAGIIDETGPGVDTGLLGREVIIYPAHDWGDNPRFPGKDFRVLGMPDAGTFAEYICVPAHQVFPKPGFLSWAQAAAIPLAGLTAWRAVVTQAAVNAGDKVLITGIGGGVAAIALKWVIALGAQAFVTSGNPDKISKAMALGAVDGVNYKEDDWPQALAASSSGIDAIIDGTGGPTFAGCFSVLNPGGRLVIYGATAGNPPQSLDLVRLFFRQVQIQGTTMGTLDEFAAMLGFMEQHRLEPVVDRVFGFDQEGAVAAHLHLQAAGQMGKIVLRIR